MSRLVLLILLLALVIVGLTYLAYRIFEEQERRKTIAQEHEHERRMERERRDYEFLERESSQNDPWKEE